MRGHQARITGSKENSQKIGKIKPLTSKAIQMTYSGGWPVVAGSLAASGSVAQAFVTLTGSFVLGTAAKTQGVVMASVTTP